MKKALHILLLFLLLSGISFSQLVSPFSILYQTNQRGDITFIGNTSMTCRDNWPAAVDEMPPTGPLTTINNDTIMAYVDIDNDPQTFQSSSDSLNLLPCSEITWAGLFWGAHILPTDSDYVHRAAVKLKVNNSAYIDLMADSLNDFYNPIALSNGNYGCYKNITNILKANGNNARYTIANVSSRTGVINKGGGWSIVIVYKNSTLKLRNLTVFSGLGVITASINSVDIPISGFLTPPSGPVSFNVGIISTDGDRGSIRDSLYFKGASTFVNLFDALNPIDDIFNSTMSINGVLTPFRVPNYNNLLGFDADIFSPNNTTFNYLLNNATSATFRMKTEGDAYYPQAITTAIDVYEPDLQFISSSTDVNGGTLNAGDTIIYRLNAHNTGSDIANSSYMIDTLDANVEYISNSIQIVHGPNAGAKTDVSNDDQAEYNPGNRVIKLRIGSGATSTVAGSITNSAQGTDSTVITFKVRAKFSCTQPQLITINRGYLYGTGQISGHTFESKSNPLLFDALGCPALGSTIDTIKVNHLTASTITTNNVSCKNGSNGNGSVLASMGDPAYDYSWSPGGYTTASVTNLPANNYTITISDKSGCTVIKNIAITEPSTSVSATALIADSVSCNGDINGTVNVVPAGGVSGFSYSWNLSGETNDTISGLSAGTYSVTVTDGNGCSATASLVLPEPTKLSVAGNATAPVSCTGGNNGAVNAVASGGNNGYSYSWSPGNNTTTSVSGLTAGIYTITVTDRKGCTVIQAVDVTQPADSIKAIAVVTDTIKCNGLSTGSANVIATGGNSGYSYNWSSGNGTNSNLDNIAAGIYFVTVSDSKGCSATASVKLTEPVALTAAISIADNIKCNGDANGTAYVIPSGGSSGFTYSWNTGGVTNDTITGLSAGTYSVTVTDKNGCSFITNINISAPSALSANINASAVKCKNGSDGMADITVSGGTTNYSYAWTPGNATTSAISNLSTGIYVVVVTDANGCSLTKTITVAEPSLSLAVTATVVDAIKCNGLSSGAAGANAVGGTLGSGYNYSWNNGASTSTINGLSAGNYTITVTDVNGCTATADVSLTEPIALSTTTTVNANVKCYGEANGIATVSVNGGVSAYSYSWSAGNATDASISGLAAGSYFIKVTDVYGCSTMDSINITQPNLLSASAITNTNINCNGGSDGSASVAVNGGTVEYNYLWNVNGATNDTIIGLAEGTYSVTVLDANGCSATSSVTLTQPAPLSLTMSSGGTICQGNSIQISAVPAGGTGNYSYSWNNGLNNTSGTHVVSPDSTTTYEVIVSDNCDTLSANTVTITVNDTPVAAFADSLLSPDDAIYQFTNQSTGATSWIWDFGDNTTSTELQLLHAFTEQLQSTVTLIVKNAAGCSDTATAEIIIKEKIDIPNVFSPNGDGVNEVLHFEAVGMKEVQLEIYNRWGLKIYESVGRKADWDGRTTSGSNVPEGTYYYILNAHSLSGKKTNKTGFITLVR